MRHLWWKAKISGIAALLSLASGSAVASHDTMANDEIVSIPAAGQEGLLMRGHLCRPLGVGRPKLVIINHGSPGNDRERETLTLGSCGSEAVAWFLRRGYAVMLVLRPGYGATGGPWLEGYDGCENADFYQLGNETADQIDQMVKYASTKPNLDASHTIVVGQSAGGWGGVAYASRPHPQVAAFINMAGGRGGHFHGESNKNCQPDELVKVAERYGRDASTPMLWIYAENDSYFGRDLSRAMHAAYVRGGGQATLAEAPAFGSDGHHLFFGPRGSEIWGPTVASYLTSQGLPTRP